MKKLAKLLFDFVVFPYLFIFFVTYFVTYFHNYFYPAPFCIERDRLLFCVQHTKEYNVFVSERKKIDDEFFHLQSMMYRSFSSFPDAHTFFEDLRFISEARKERTEQLCRNLLMDESFCSSLSFR